MKIRIANICIEIDRSLINLYWLNYVTDCRDADFFIERLNKEKTFYGISQIDYLKESFVNCFYYGNEVMFGNKHWTHFYIFPFENVAATQALILLAFYSNSVKHRMIQIHSSLISYAEKGIMFLGPSGIGKTTQAELWNKYKGTTIINGDRVFVQETTDGFLGWGTPWHGSSPYCENTSVPLKAMVVLRQAPENSIRELTGFEKVSEVSNSVFYPQWLENGMELCLETLDHLLTNIPVYQLSCRPDEDAVRLTEQAIFGTSGL